MYVEKVNYSPHRSKKCHIVSYLKQHSKQIKTNSAEVHYQLFKHRQLGKSNHQYIYAMQEIADDIGWGLYIEEEAFIQYIINGIPDEECNKIMLYGARIICEWRYVWKCTIIWRKKRNGRRMQLRKIILME